MPNAYCYHRFSSPRQEKGLSLERQAELTAKRCQALNLTIVETLEDKGKSAWTGDHLRVGKLGQFKTRVDAGLIEPGSYLVVENLDRLSRQDVKFARRWLEDVTDRGIIIAVCTPEIILDSEALSGSNIVAMIQYLMEANRSTAESNRKSEMMEKTVKVFMSKARQGISYTARSPGWLHTEKDKPATVIEERAEIVRQIYRWSADGLGIHAIAKKLNDTVEPWGKSYKHGQKWKPGYIRDVLASPAVEGEYHVKAGPENKPTGEVIHGLYPRIVDAELVERARSAILKRRGTGGRGRTTAANLFAGRIMCGHCGDAMVRTVQRQKFEYLKCARFNSGGAPKADDPPEVRARKCVNTTQYRYDKFEKAALAQILHLALDDSFFIRSDDISPLAGRVADLKKEVERLTQQQTRLLTFVMENDDAEEAKAMLGELRPKLDAAKNALQTTTDELDAAKGQASPEEHLRRVLEVKDVIYSSDPEEREQARRKVRDAIQSVVSVVECKRYDPDPNAKPYRATPIKEITMALAGGYLAYRFDGEGQLLGKISLQGLPDLMKGAASATGPGVIETVARRRSLKA